jgi:lipopolysaccharide assembly outer membrane protein LptD (OstA)
MEFDYLNSDKVYEDEHPKDDNSRRWLFYWQHSGVMDQVWRFNVDYTKVSDTSYFNDFDNKYGSSTDGYATQNSASATRYRTLMPQFRPSSSRSSTRKTVTATLRSRS